MHALTNEVQRLDDVVDTELTANGCRNIQPGISGLGEFLRDLFLSQGAAPISTKTP